MFELRLAAIAAVLVLGMVALSAFLAGTVASLFVPVTRAFGAL